jgi:hypothetical protein
MRELTFDDLLCRHFTGRSYIQSGEGRNRVCGYRVGVQCSLGDIEQSEWFRMVRELIERKGEQHLYEQLLEYLTEHNYTRSTKIQLERKALELHADRIFDNEAWVGFLEFNQKYPPEVAASTKVVHIRTECCGEPGAIPQTQLDSCKHLDDRVRCPHCGRWAHYEILTTIEMEERTYACE